jgi:hypothetical protein
MSTEPPAAVPGVGTSEAPADTPAAGHDAAAESATVLRFTAAHQCVVPDHIRALLDTDAARAATALNELVSEGLIRRNQAWHREPPQYQITAGGIEAIGSQLQQPRLETIRDYRHVVGVAWVTLAALRGAFGETELIITEREMRAADRALGQADPEAANTARFGIPIQTVGQPRTVQYPDLLIGAPGGQIAINLQSTMPGSRRIEAIINGYKHSPHVSLGLFLTNDPDIRDLISQLAAKLEMSESIRIQRARSPRPLPALAQ